MFTIAKREDQGPPLPQSGFPSVGVDGLACCFGHIVGVDVLGDPFLFFHRRRRFAPVGRGFTPAESLPCVRGGGIRGLPSMTEGL